MAEIFPVSKVYKMVLLAIMTFLFLLFTKTSHAATTASLLPTSDGNYTQFSPSTGSSHFALVDETSCNGNTDYNSETTVGQRDSYGLNLSSIPDGSTISQISITPCASKNANGGSNTTFDVFYRLDGVDSADMPGYMLSTTIPATLSSTNYTGLSVSKNGSTTLEVGGLYTAGNKGLRLSRISVVVTYTPPSPSVTTNSADSVTQTTAILNSMINPNGSSTTGNYRYGTSNVGCSSLSSVTSNNSLGSGTTDVPNPQSVATLSANTTYYFCATATNSGGTTYGSVLSFTTLPNSPTVVTASATSITSTTATLSGYVTPNGGSTDRVFRYGTSNSSCSSLPNTTSPINVGSGTSQVFGSQGVSSLSALTTYYYCVSATNAGGTSYGSVFSFTTTPPSSAPSVTTLNASSITSTSASVSALINPNYATTTRIFRYDTVNTTCDALSNTTISANLGSGGSSVLTGLTIFSLTPNTTYYYCAEATNSEGMTYGSVQSFTTLP